MPTSPLLLTGPAAALPFGIEDVEDRRMRFVEEDHTIEVVADPIEDLLQAAVIAADRPQGGICDEKNALREFDWLIDFPVADRLNVSRQPTKRRPITAGVFKQGFVLRNPDVAPTALKPIVENAGSDLTPCARSRAVSKK